jgi:multidrug resistance efflux pump
MSTPVSVAKHVIHDMLETKIKILETKLETLKARAESAKANAELKATTELLTKKLVIRQKLQELKDCGGDRWEKTKTDLEARITELEKSVKEIESKVKPS